MYNRYNKLWNDALASAPLSEHGTPEVSELAEFFKEKEICTAAKHVLFGATGLHNVLAVHVNIFEEIL